MKQLIQDLRRGLTQVIEAPVPSPGIGMVLIKTAASVVSVGTERGLVEFAGKSLLGKARSRPDLVRQTLEKVRREGLVTTLDAIVHRLDQPMPLGYSSAGEIVELGQAVEAYRVGDRVACAGGGYAVHAEYAVVPERLVARLPDNVSFEAGAFATLGAIALHGFRLAQADVGAYVAVIGLGVLGRLAAEIAEAAGCLVLGIDVDLGRVDAARQHGLQAVGRDQAEERAAAFTRGQGCDAVLICADTTSSDPVELAAQIARDRAYVVSIGAVGLEIPRRAFYHKELTFLVSRSYGPGRYDRLYEEAGIDYPLGYVRWTEERNLQAVVGLMGQGRVQAERLITHRFPIEGAEEAYEMITDRDGEPFLGVVVSYPDSQRPGLRPSRIKLSDAPAHPQAQARLGVIGAGNFATSVLLPALKGLPQLELVGLATASGMTSAAAGRRFGFQYASSRPEDLLEDEQINTIAVLTRHHLHAEQTIAALAAGKHVFCEKPLAIDEDSLHQVIDALPQAPGILTVGFNRRFAPLARRLKQVALTLDEPLAVSYRVNAGRLPAEHWLHDPAQGGGRIIGEACHFIDFLVFLIGELPEAIAAQGLPDDRRYKEDNVIISLRFPGGSLGTLAYLSNGDRSFPKERVEVFGGGMVAVLDDFRRLDIVRSGRRRSWRSRLKQDKGHRAIWEAFLKSIATGAPPPIRPDELFAVSRASIAAVEALRSGGWLDL
jgi:predicted dehydrogenase/threonine dehydrogenase-like Zn-dependent dehydrogenase